MLIGISIFLLLLVMLLSISISLKFEFDLDHISENKIVLSWFFGLVELRIPMQQEEAPKPKKESNKSKQKKAINTGKTIFKVLIQKNFRQQFFNYMSDLWHSISKEDIRFYIKLGLGDPAETGKLWAIIGPTSGALSNVNQFSLVIEPDFINAGFQLNGSGAIRFTPLRIIFISLKLFFSRTLWKGIWHFRAGNNSC